MLKFLIWLFLLIYVSTYSLESGLLLIVVSFLVWVKLRSRKRKLLKTKRLKREEKIADLHFESHLKMSYVIRPHMLPIFIGISRINKVELLKDTIEITKIDGKKTSLTHSKTISIELQEGIFSTKKIVIDSTICEPITIPYLKDREASSFVVEAGKRLESAHGKLRREIAKKKDDIDEVYGEALKIYNGDQYVNNRSVSNWQNKNYEINNFLTGVKHIDVQDDNLKDRITLCLRLFEPNSLFIPVRNKKWVTNEIKENDKWFCSIDKFPLTEQQKEAVVRDEDACLVVAGAGTGKTATVVAKVGYLLKIKHVKPEQILVLAFARKAREELEDRIQNRFGETLEIRTFHSLGKEILDNCKGYKSTVSKIASDKGISERIHQDILEELFTVKKLRSKILIFFAYYLKPYKSEFAFNSLKEYNRFRKNQELVTLKKETVKSQEELTIANWLFANGVVYEYEAPYKHEMTADSSHQQYTPDFYLPEYDIYIEHFGIDRKGDTAPFVNREKYNSDLEWKRRLHRQKRTVLIETFTYDRMEGQLVSRLEKKLRAKKVKFAPLSTEELKKSLKELGNIRPVSRLFETFLGLYKSSQITLDELRQRAAERDDPIRTSAFLDLFEYYYEQYHSILERDKTIDFNDMIKTATDLVTTGQYSARFSYYIVDEFQDISKGRAALLKAMVDQAEDPRLFAVGDDWQSIFRFNGADIGIMTNFGEYFDTHHKAVLDKTFRFNDKILEASSRFISSNPNQIRKSLKSPRRSTKPRITIFPGREADRFDYLKQILAKINDSKHDATVLILARNNSSINNLPKNLQNQFDSLEIKTSTIHSAKGLEADYVILHDVKSGKNGIPSEMSDDPVLELLLAADHDFPNSEERRLFYVAMTRARDHVFILSDIVEQSGFVDELMGSGYEKYVRIHKRKFDNALCPKCDGNILQRNGRFGVFWSCEFYPYCDGKLNLCPECNEGALVNKDLEHRCNNIECGNISATCPRCQTGFLLLKNGKHGEFWSCNTFPKCRYSRDKDMNLQEVGRKAD